MKRLIYDIKNYAGKIDRSNQSKFWSTIKSIRHKLHILKILLELQTELDFIAKLISDNLSEEESVASDDNEVLNSISEIGTLFEEFVETYNESERVMDLFGDDFLAISKITDMLDEFQFNFTPIITGKTKKSICKTEDRQQLSTDAIIEEYESHFENELHRVDSNITLKQTSSNVFEEDEPSEVSKQKFPENDGLFGCFLPDIPTDFTFQRNFVGMSISQNDLCKDVIIEESEEDLFIDSLTDDLNVYNFHPASYKVQDTFDPCEENIEEIHENEKNIEDESNRTVIKEMLSEVIGSLDEKDQSPVAKSINESEESNTNVVERETWNSNDGVNLGNSTDLQSVERNSEKFKLVEIEDVETQVTDSLLSSIPDVLDNGLKMEMEDTRMLLLQSTNIIRKLQQSTAVILWNLPRYQNLVQNIRVIFQSFFDAFNRIMNQTTTPRLSSINAEKNDKKQDYQENLELEMNKYSYSDEPEEQILSEICL